MGNLIILEEKPVQAQGLNSSAFPDEKKIPNYFFDDEYENLKLLKKIKRLSSPKEEPLLFYPSCGADVLNPLIYFEKIFPQTKKANFLFLDLDNNLRLIKTILDDLDISFSEQKNNLLFYWKDILIHLEFREGNVFTALETIPPFDIYFERAFRIMREESRNYEEKIFQKLTPGGIIISDSGYQNLPLKKITVPKELSSYKEMIIGIKEK